MGTTEQGAPMAEGIKQFVEWFRTMRRGVA